MNNSFNNISFLKQDPKKNDEKNLVLNFSNQKPDKNFNLENHENKISIKIKHF